MTVPRSLAIRLPARHVGELQQAREGRVRWRPDATWQADGQHPRLGLDFLRTPGPRETSGELPAWFENLLPEKETALRARLCAIHRLHDGQPYALLGAVGGDLAGAVEAHGRELADAGRVEAAPRGSHEEAGRADGPNEEGAHLSALAGNQLKFSMSMVNERLTLGARVGHQQWIVKLPGAKYPELSEVEHATMSWATAAGFDVPRHRVLPMDQLEGIPASWLGSPSSDGVFAILRFDRRVDGSKIHHEDLCQALALRPANKYGDRAPGVTFEGALRLVVDTCGEDAGREMARRMGFVIASGNDDAHLENWALPWGERSRPVLAPCCDLVATISWPQLGWGNRTGPRLALKLGGERRFAYIDEERLSECARLGGYGWVKDEILHGAIRARDAWSGLTVAVPERMQAALAEHWRRVPALVWIGER